jgi:hypothetical protein
VQELSTPFARENTVLLDACRVDRRPPEPDQIRGLDWAHLWTAADRQGVAPLVADWMSSLADSGGPDAVPLHDTYWMNHFRNQVLLAELERVQRAAGAAGIDTMPMKGASLATAYYESPALRVMSDIDLLARPQDLSRLAAVMSGLNYYAIDTARSYVDERLLDDSSREHSWVAMRDGLQVLIEIRTASIEPAIGRLTDLDRPFTLLLHRYTEEVWERARVSRTVGEPLCVPPEDVLLTVATHLAAKHVDFRLIWLRDIARIAIVAPTLDWDYVARTAARLRVTAPVTAALRAAVQWLGAPISEAQLAKVSEPLRTGGGRWLERWDDKRLRRLVATIGTRDLTVGGPGVWPLVSALSRVRGPGAMFRVLRWVGFPSRDYLKHRGIETPAGVLGYGAATVRRVMGGLRAGLSRAGLSTQP